MRNQCDGCQQDAPVNTDPIRPGSPTWTADEEIPHEGARFDDLVHADQEATLGKREAFVAECEGYGFDGKRAPTNAAREE